MKNRSGLRNAQNHLPFEVLSVIEYSTMSERKYRGGMLLSVQNASVATEAFNVWAKQ